MQKFGTEKKSEIKGTPQNKKIEGREKEMRANNAGGFSFRLDKWARLERFLILGTEGGTYYVSEKKLDKQNTTNLLKCIEEDYTRTVDTIVAISEQGRSIKNDMAIFALAVVSSSKIEGAGAYAMQNLGKVCRIGTHLFHFAEYLHSMHSWSRFIRKAVEKWYTDKGPDELAFQLLKYKQRDGWCHKDILTLTHVRPTTEEQSVLFRAAIEKGEWPNGIRTCEGYNLVNAATSADQIVPLISKYNTPREFLRTEFLNDARVWEAMLPSMPVMALIRNLGKMASLGILHGMSPYTNLVVEKLTDEKVIQNSKVHPMSILNALKIYSEGSNREGAKRGREMKWEPNAKITDALQCAFHMSFKNVPSTGKSILLALDVSGSMTNRMSNSSLNCREASALMAMVTAKVEKNYGIYGFTSFGRNTFAEKARGPAYFSCGEGISELNIGPNMAFDHVINSIEKLPFTSTDCSLPVLMAIERKLVVDVFCIYTDNETWEGHIQPSQALVAYREKINPKAKMVVVGMTANNISIADPKDGGMLDVVGFDTNTPSAIAEFIKD